MGKEGKGTRAGVGGLGLAFCNYAVALLIRGDEALCCSRRIYRFPLGKNRYVVFLRRTTTWLQKGCDPLAASTANLWHLAGQLELGKGWGRERES